MIYDYDTWNWDMCILGGVWIKLADLRYELLGFKFYCASYHLVSGANHLPLCAFDFLSVKWE